MFGISLWNWLILLVIAGLVTFVVAILRKK